ncbi:MOSC domain-containing protein [Aquipuribacter nitratireducens]|uniref:MOSC domain-containing protein n=1 Tax=Aquipuribacter nitratireducens TaxID=650104 RepID=A0ABW0GN34_9MICO
MDARQGDPSGRAGAVLAVHAAAEAPASGFAKQSRDELLLVADHGAADDRHAGRDLREVHLVDVARYRLLRAAGHDVGPGYLGENVTTDGVDLLALPAGTVLAVGGRARLRLTGMRFPRHEDPATDRVGVDLDPAGVPVGRVGVFAVVLAGGRVRAGDAVRVLHVGDDPLHPL